MAIIEDDIKQETHRKRCFMCGRTRIYPWRMKEPRVPLSFLWQEYGGIAICVKYLIGNRAA
jgi:hypothetical protein